MLTTLELRQTFKGKTWTPYMGAWTGLSRRASHNIKILLYISLYLKALEYAMSTIKEIHVLYLGTV